MFFGRDLAAEQCVERLVEKAIEEGKLFELIFSEEGRKLWDGFIKQDKMKKLVRYKISQMAKKEK